MKNSENNSVKSQAQNAAVTAVKVIVYPAHLVCQTAADLLNLGQAHAIKTIDGTEIHESLFAQATWTAIQQFKVVNQYMKVVDRIEKQREANRQQDIEKLQKALDKAQGVEHVKTEPTPVVSTANTEPTPTSVVTPTPVVSAPVVPAPPVETPFVPINKRGPKADKKVPVMTSPLMTPAEAFNK